MCVDIGNQGARNGHQICGTHNKCVEFQHECVLHTHKLREIQTKFVQIENQKNQDFSILIETLQNEGTDACAIFQVFLGEKLWALIRIRQRSIWCSRTVLKLQRYRCNRRMEQTKWLTSQRYRWNRHTKETYWHLYPNDTVEIDIWNRRTDTDISTIPLKWTYETSILQLMYQRYRWIGNMK